VAGARAARLWRRGARAAARRRDDFLEARLKPGLAEVNHPIFAPLARWLHLERSLEALNRCAEVQGITNANGQRIRFVAPGGKESYEMQVFETGRVSTRPDSLHDWFNALVWLAFPRTKARLNAMHAAEIPREAGRRGRLRDMLTLFDEGGALVVSDDAALVGLVREMRWRELFWERREQLRRAMGFAVLGHAVLEQALEPWAGITCKAIFVSPAGSVVSSGRSLDEQAAQWLAACGPEVTPKDLAALPVFGYPGWLPASGNAEFYDDARYFRTRA
jgi:Protein of unknown function (DUF3025)